MIFNIIEEEYHILKYLEVRNLLNQYKKTKNLLLLWNLQQVSFRIRNPKKDQIYYFKINSKVFNTLDKKTKTKKS